MRPFAQDQLFALRLGPLAQEGDGGRELCRAVEPRRLLGRHEAEPSGGLAGRAGEAAGMDLAQQHGLAHRGEASADQGPAAAGQDVQDAECGAAHRSLPLALGRAGSLRLCRPAGRPQDLSRQAWNKTAGFTSPGSSAEEEAGWLVVHPAFLEDIDKARPWSTPGRAAVKAASGRPAGRPESCLARILPGQMRMSANGLPPGLSTMKSRTKPAGPAST